MQTDIPFQFVEKDAFLALLVGAVQLQAERGAQEVEEADQIPPDNFLCPRQTYVVFLCQAFQNLTDFPLIRLRFQFQKALLPFLFFQGMEQEAVQIVPLLVAFEDFVQKGGLQPEKQDGALPS